MWFGHGTWARYLTCRRLTKGFACDFGFWQHSIWRAILEAPGLRFLVSGPLVLGPLEGRWRVRLGTVRRPIWGCLEG